MTTSAEFTATLARLRPNEQVRRRVGAVVLEVVEGPQAGRRHEITQPVTTLGRGAQSDLVIDDVSLSAAHVEITLGTDLVIVRDLDSRNGTWVGLARVLDRVALPDGGDFFAGNSRFVVHIGGEIEVPLAAESSFHGMRGSSEAMRELFALLDRLAPTPLTALVLGETGTGKEEVARALHVASGRRGPFIVLDCGALPRDLAEAAIFGYRKGSFTGATSDRAGSFEEAEGGTLFLDELGELPLDLQPKLLRVLDRHEVQRLGEHHVRAVDVRLVSATHRDLRLEITEGRFRLDLYHRLAQVVVRVPPLRERPDDVELLARYFADGVARRTGRQLVIGDDAMARLRELSWEGNVRQLKHAIERACYLARGSLVTRHELFVDEGPAPPAADEEALFALPLKVALEQHGDAFARRYCERLLVDTAHDLDKAAERAQYSRKGLRELLKRLGLLDA